MSGVRLFTSVLLPENLLPFLRRHPSDLNSSNLTEFKVSNFFWSVCSVKILILLGREREKLAFDINKCNSHFIYTLSCSTQSMLSVEGLKLQSLFLILALAVSQFEFSCHQNLTNFVCGNIFFIMKA